MSRKFIPCLGVALGAAMIAGTPAFAYSSVTEAVLQQSSTTSSTTSSSQGAAGSPTTEPTTSTSGAADSSRPAGSYQDASPSTAGSMDLGDRIEQVWAEREDLADADIEASVEGNRVVLEGEVSSAAQRQTAERLAKRVKGVTTVDNRIAIRMASSPTNNERDGEREGTRGSVVAEDAKDTARVVGDKTEDAVDATGSAIGKAAGATRDAVVTAAKKTAGFVKGTPEKIDETWITSKIAAKINADDALEHVDVDVKVKKNVVTIIGPVPSAALRDRVLRIARETEGVERVVDQMTITRGGGGQQ